jgi:hypothetical protein
MARDYQKNYSPKNPRRRETHNRVERAAERRERRSGQKACEGGYQEYEMEQELLKEWERFASGHWQKEMPRQEGIYPLHARDCPTSISTVGTVIRHNNKSFCAEYNPIKPGTFHHSYEGTCFAGWWWSEPFPKLPSPPSWGEE